jgi:hypothetical protein
MIEELISSTYGEVADVRSRHLFLHALQGLVRVAKAEQLRQLRADVALASGEPASAQAWIQCQALLGRAGLVVRDVADDWPQG